MNFEQKKKKILKISFFAPRSIRLNFFGITEISKAYNFVLDRRNWFIFSVPQDLTMIL